MVKMKKWKLHIMMVLVMFLLTIVVSIGTEVQYSADNSTWENVTTINEGNQFAYEDFLLSGTRYYFRVRNDTSNWTYVDDRTSIGVESVMAGLSVTLFVLVIPLVLLLISGILYFKERNTEELERQRSLIIISRSLLVIATYLMTLNSGVIATIADSAGLSVTNEIFRYMWILGWMGYLLIAYVVIKTVLDVLKITRDIAFNKRMGVNEVDE